VDRARGRALARERFDLVMERRHYFGVPMQRLPRFTRQPDCAVRAGRLTGYEVSACGEVSFCF